jgi:hypothetical protein
VPVFAEIFEIMKPLYSSADVDRWVIQNAKARQLLERRLGTNWKSANDAQGLSLLSMTFEAEGFTAVALGNREVAMNNFAESVAVTVKVLDMGRKGINGAEGYVRTGYFQTLLTAWAIDDDRLIKEFLDVFQVEGTAADRSPADSTYIARTLKALSMGRLGDAERILAFPARDVDPQFVGYVDCLTAIAESRMDEFKVALRRSADAWERFTREDGGGQPQSACFIGGLGLLNLAKRLGLKLNDLVVDHIPALLKARD